MDQFTTSVPLTTASRQYNFKVKKNNLSNLKFRYNFSPLFHSMCPATISNGSSEKCRTIRLLKFATPIRCGQDFAIIQLKLCPQKVVLRAKITRPA